MDIKWDSTYVDLENLVGISRGNKERMLDYLNQFQELVPQRVQDLKRGLQDGDRKMICRVIHQMSPQMLFFGIPDVLESIQRLENEYQTMPFEELNSLTQDILAKLDGATAAVAGILKNHFP